MIASEYLDGIMVACQGIMNEIHPAETAFSKQANDRVVFKENLIVLPYRSVFPETRQGGICIHRSTIPHHCHQSQGWIDRIHADSVREMRVSGKADASL